MKTFSEYLNEAKHCSICNYHFDKSTMDKHPTGEGFWMFEYTTEDGQTLAIDTPEPMMFRQAEEYLANEAQKLGVEEGTTFRVRYK